MATRPVGSTARRCAKIVIDPMIFLAGTAIPFVLLLEAINESPFSIFNILHLANEKNAASNVVATLAPMGIISSFAVLGSMVKLILDLIDQQERRIRDVLAKADALFFPTLLVSSIVLSLSTIVLLANFKGLVNQERAISGELYTSIWACSILCFGFSFLVSILLSARSVPLIDMRQSMTGQTSETSEPDDTGRG